MKEKTYSPETLMMSYGHDPQLSVGAIKCPIYQTSTFVFKTAEEGKAFFEVAYGLREKRKDEELGLIYSRLNNPDLEILENRLTLWDGGEDAAVFESGMSAISTVLMEFLKPGDLLIYSEPLYGGTDHLIRKILPEYNIHILNVTAKDTEEDILVKVHNHPAGDRLKFIYLETPGNPTNDLLDISLYRKVADRLQKDHPILVGVDNTYLGPVWQHPLKHGADLVVYSATKYIGGHSDVIAGAVIGSKENIARVKTLRTFFGNMAGPWTGWLLMRSLETLKIRMEKQVENAKKIAEYLADHPMVEKVYYLGELNPEDGEQYKIFKKQCLSTGAMVSFDIKGNEATAFKFLNNIKLIKLAVSLGGTESLAEHPATMTHADVDQEMMDKIGLTEKMVRLSIGIENYKDIISDIDQALEKCWEVAMSEASPSII